MRTRSYSLTNRLSVISPVNRWGRETKDKTRDSEVERLKEGEPEMRGHGKKGKRIKEREENKEYGCSPPVTVLNGVSTGGLYL